ncbi:MAG: AmmeMemoRadiSam system protein B [Acidobacteria bacterium]|nr:AmmeMemoRadiSam system protein B [Acidobacteriota bacterium]
MRLFLLMSLAVVHTSLAGPQAALPLAQAAPPTLAEVRAGMGIPSAGDVRGQQDTVGFASTAAQMARVWELSATPPAPERLGPDPSGTVVGVLCPHDDYLYAGRAYRQVLPLVKAKTVVLIGVFHKYRAFGARDLVVFDDYRAWRTPDGEVPVSALRGAILARLPAADFVQDDAGHDREHSLEPLVAWLRHHRPDVEIVPIIVPASPLPRLEELARHVGGALAAAMRERGLQLGPDVAVAISSDAVHYGSDFTHTPFGEGGIEAYAQAVARDRELLAGPLAGPLSAGKAREFSAACVSPDDPNVYRLTWCGRFSIPFGLLLLGETASALGLPAPTGFPISYSTSVGQPELPVREVGLGETAPANLYHFVGFPAAAYAIAP